ncbi:hypothetical protein J6F09_004539 [Salmonella enterica subsp. diarizonae serovar 61:k:1,5,(7)]|nr:hypothetical protein [Salmonella enterica]ECJ2436725.1 hypothetical protein [Salmonella enterica subsp. diarizonae]EHG8822856.1 hypothetical protein [Salmonella enterica subsp. diarizonae serovar 61:k:1,5,(7)]
MKHPGDWYCTSDDPVWQAFFTTLLKKEAPEWYSYGIRFLNATRWMDQVPDMSRTPWHMHPQVFLDAISTSKKRGWAHSPFADLLGCVESKNDYTAYNQIFHSPERSENLHLLEFEKVSKSVRDELARMMGMVIMMAMV